MAALLGGMRIVEMYWSSQFALNVRFETTYSNKLYQLYYGRELVGSTTTVDERLIIGSIVTDINPDHLQLVAVDTANRLTDYGSTLPDRPYNRLRVDIDTDGWPADTRVVQLASGINPGDAVSNTNVIASSVYDTDRVYRLTSNHFRASGTWSLAAFGRDNKLPDGNIGDKAEFTVDIIAYPADVVNRSDGTRFDIVVEEGVATATFMVV